MCGIGFLIKRKYAMINILSCLSFDTDKEDFTVRAIITVIGQDTVGILAKVSNICAGHNANIIEVTQSILQDLFCMIMLVDISNLNTEYVDLSSALGELGEQMGLSIHVMHEDVFNSMHHI